MKSHEDEVRYAVGLDATVEKIMEAAREAEREECAKLADEHAEAVGDDGMGGEVWIATNIAAAIRARGSA